MARLHGSESLAVAGREALHGRGVTSRRTGRNQRALWVASIVSLGALLWVWESSFYDLVPSETYVDPPACVSAVNRLRKANIRLVAIDFDYTILDIHTGGQWEGSATRLARHVRPEFRCFIDLCLENGINVAVATFSTQTKLISTVLWEAIPHHTAKEIPIFGRDSHVVGAGKGKQSQLILAMEHFNAQWSNKALNYFYPITPSSTLLIDDDITNIAIADADGYHTIRYDPEHEKEDSLFDAKFLN